MNVLRWRPQVWHRLDVTLQDLPLALLLFFPSFMPMFFNYGTQLGGVPDRPFDALAVVVVALQSFPLAIRRRWPTLCLTLIAVGFAVDQILGYHTFAGTGLAIAVLSSGVHLQRRRRLTTLLFSLAYVPLAVVLYRIGVGEPVSEFVTFYLALALVWCLGSWVRSTRIAEAEHRRRLAQDVLAAERARIARELHDVVTHHVTAMVVQTEAARYLTAAPDRLDQALASVTDTGRRATSDLRRLLDLIDPDHGTDEARTPHTGGFTELVEHTRGAGQPVEFTEEGSPAESSGSADLVAFRVVQEALTNALKYAHGTPTSVRVRHGRKEITVRVETGGPGMSVASTGGGRGLIGLRERVEVLGGDFSAGERTDGGFAVEARVPVGGRS
ncbi:sensor histidine kinase [Nocardiopsis alkaliphila]|uniref:sensor histidine kinase n=1 Tax=Nocardiopsis alkaliphila TaxID=225762 RepID=UPI00068517A1|nr:histidine kinase [Nocardiopsis alkaliphila]